MRTKEINSYFLFYMQVFDQSNTIKLTIKFGQSNVRLPNGRQSHSIERSITELLLYLDVFQFIPFNEGYDYACVLYLFSTNTITFLLLAKLFSQRSAAVPIICREGIHSN